MAKQKQTEAEIQSEVNEWRIIAGEYLKNQYAWVAQAKKDVKRKRERKTPDPHAARKANLLEIVSLYDEKTCPSSLRLELAAWKKIGRAVLANVEEDNPRWCSIGTRRLDDVRRLLGIKPIREYLIHVRTEELTEDEMNHRGTYTMKMYNKEGKIVREGKVTNITTY